MDLQSVLQLLTATVADLATFLTRLVPLFLAGLFLAGVMTRSPLAGRLSIVMSPLTRLSRLPEECSLVFMLTVMSRGAGLVAVADLFKKGILDSRQAIAAIMCSFLPAALHHILFFAGPISLAMLGFRTAAVFMLALFVIGVIRTLVGVAISRTIRRGPLSGPAPAGEKSPEAAALTWVQILAQASKSAILQLLKIMKVLVPSLFVALLLIKSGAMDALGLAVSPITAALGLPSAAFLLIVTATPSTIAGVSMAGALILAGDLTHAQAVLSLVIAHFFNRQYLLLRTWMPINISVFGGKLGSRISLTTFFAEFVWIPFFILYLLF